MESIINPRAIPQNNDFFFKVLGAISKVFVGELTEEARKIQLEHQTHRKREMKTPPPVKEKEEMKMKHKQ